MAAPAPLPADELLPKGGAGKAEELEDELEEDDDDEEVAGSAGGENQPSGVTLEAGRALTPRLFPAAGRDPGGAAVGADRDVPRERPLGGRRHLRAVADGGAEGVQVRAAAGGGLFGDAERLRAADGSLPDGAFPSLGSPGRLCGSGPPPS